MYSSSKKPHGRKDSWGTSNNSLSKSLKKVNDAFGTLSCEKKDSKVPLLNLKPLDEMIETAVNAASQNKIGNHDVDSNQNEMEKVLTSQRFVRS